MLLWTSSLSNSVFDGAKMKSSLVAVFIPRISLNTTNQGFSSLESVVKYLMYQSITGGEWPQGLCWGLGLGVAAFPTSVSPLQVTDHLLVSASDEPGPLPQSGGPSWLFFRSPDSPHLLLTPHMLLRSVGTLMYSHTGWFVLRSLVTGSFHCYPGNLHGNSSGSPPWVTWEFLDPFYS